MLPITWSVNANIPGTTTAARTARRAAGTDHPGRHPTPGLAPIRFREIRAVLTRTVCRSLDRHHGRAVEQRRQAGFDAAGQRLDVEDMVAVAGDAEVERAVVGEDRDHDPNRPDDRDVRV